VRYPCFLNSLQIFRVDAINIQSRCCKKFRVDDVKNSDLMVSKFKVDIEGNLWETIDSLWPFISSPNFNSNGLPFLQIQDSNSNLGKN
jgi:hypothetical protein